MPDPSFKTISARRTESQRGAALVLFTIMLVLIVLPMVGFAIDGGVAYLAHERLVAATDAAALAGARALNIGLTVDSQAANVQSIAQQYFYANFPPGLLNSVSATVNVPPPVQTSYHTVTVQVQSSATVKLYFMNLIGFPTVSLNASSSTSRRDVNVVLALDRSGSMLGVCTVMKNDAINFVSRFVNGRDTVGLVTFMGNANIDYSSTKNFMSQKPSIVDTLNKLKCGGNTGSAAALSLAQQQIGSVSEPGALNVIVFFTDGVPNGYLAGPATPGANPGFPLKDGKTCNSQTYVPGFISNSGGINDSSKPQQIFTVSTPVLTTCPWGSFGTLAQAYSYIPGTDAYGNSATASGLAAVARDGNNQIKFTSANSDAISKNAADDAARSIRNAGTIIYTIGLDGDGGVDNTLLRRIANDPASPIFNSSLPAGQYYYSPNAGQLGAAFNSIASEILRLSR